MSDVPQAWIKQYVDTLLRVAQQMNPGPMQTAMLLRADHAMDLVEAFRKQDLGKAKNI